jgi:hypothetical protein
MSASTNVKRSLYGRNRLAMRAVSGLLTQPQDSVIVDYFNY